jgi:nitrile hydratase
MPGDGATLPPPDALTKAVESILIEHGLVDTSAIDRRVAERVRQLSATPPGARLVARAWMDDASRQQLIADAVEAAAALGLPPLPPIRRTVIVENTDSVRNVVVCTLCSCFSSLAGLKPTWYKSPACRSRVVLEPRAVLREFGLAIDDEVEVRVWDTSAEHRYLVLPRRPAGTEAYGEDQLAALVTTEALLGVALPRPA